MANDPNKYFTNIGTTCRVYNGTNNISHDISIDAKFKFTESTVEQVLEELPSRHKKQVGLKMFVLSSVSLVKKPLLPFLQNF